MSMNSYLLVQKYFGVGPTDLSSKLNNYIGNMII